MGATPEDPMRKHARLYLVLLCGGAAVAAAMAAPQSPDPQEYLTRSRQFSERMEARGLADPFTGVTTDGRVVPGLYEVRSTGVSTAPVVAAAGAFLRTLDAETRDRTLFAIDADEWRKWANQHIYFREGLSFDAAF
jgi:hypothetical protein